MCQSSPWSSAVAPEETPPYATSRSPSLPKKEKSSAEWSYRAESRHTCTYLRGVTIADPSVPEVNHRMARMTTRDRSEVGGQTLSPAEADSWADRRPEPQARGAARTREEGAGMTTGGSQGRCSCMGRTGQSSRGQSPTWRAARSALGRSPRTTDGGASRSWPKPGRNPTTSRRDGIELPGRMVARWPGTTNGTAMRSRTRQPKLVLPGVSQALCSCAHQARELRKVLWPVVSVVCAVHIRKGRMGKCCHVLFCRIGCYSNVSSSLND